MASVVIEELLDMASVRFSNTQKEVVRGFRVTDLPLDISQTKALLDILKLKEIPKVGSVLTEYSDLQLDDIEVRPDGYDALVVCTYRVLSSLTVNISETAPAQIEVGSSLAEVVTERDIFGNQITTKHIFPDLKDAEGRPREIIQTGEVRKFEVVHTVTFSRREPNDPAEKSLRFTGAVNAGYWRNGADHTWLCQGITGNSQDNGKSYDVKYLFAYSRDTWDPVIVATHPETRERVLNPKWGEGIKYVRTAPEENFTTLNLGRGF